MATVMSMWLIGLAVTFAALLVAAWRLFNWIKSGSYLLSSKYIVESPSPVVIDQNERNAVLRQEYSPEKVPQNLDAIVIGSGIGGLSAAVFLARAGKKVLVLERNYRAGGMCSSFNSKNGVEFDIDKRKMMLELLIRRLPICPQAKLSRKMRERGLYNFGFLHDKSNPFTITFNHLTKGKVGFDKIPGTCDRVVIGSVKDCPRYEGFGGPLFQNLLRILKYTAFKYQDQSLMKVINDAGVQDQKLRATMEYITAMAGLDATTCSYITFSLILWCYNAPSYYPTGGANEIPFHLIPQIEEAGGRVLVNACVNQILFSDDGKAQGVKVVPTNAEDASENDHRIYAPVVVSDAGIMNTFQRGLVPDHIARKSRYYKYCQDVGPSDSYFHVMVVLDGTADELGLEPNMLWYVKDTDTMEHPELSRKMDIDRQITEDIAWFGSSCHSAKDSSWNDRFPGKSAMQLGFSCDYEGLKKYEGKNGVRVNADEYNASKETLGRKAWDKFCEYYPKCRSRPSSPLAGSGFVLQVGRSIPSRCFFGIHIAFGFFLRKLKVEQFEVGSALTYNRHLNTVKGELYGLDHSMARTRPVAIAEMRSKTDIPGLYLTGTDSFFCSIPAVAWSGLACACEILGYKALAAMLFVTDKSPILRTWILGY